MRWGKVEAGTVMQLMSWQGTQPTMAGTYRIFIEVYITQTETFIYDEPVPPLMQYTFVGGDKQ